jgi:hypothetical protein
MADPKDKTTATGSTRPAGKSAAVKPPVLEGTARPAESPKSTQEPPIAPDKAAEAGPRPASLGEPAKPAASDTKIKTESPSFAKPAETTPATPSGGNPWLAGIAGGILGLGGAYGLAFLGLWPTPPVAPPPVDTRISTLSATVPELQTVTSTLQDELATLTARVAGFESASEPGQPAADPQAAAATNQLTADIAALSARIDELSQAPQTVTALADRNAATIEAMEADIAELRQATADARARIDGVTNQVATISTDIDAGLTADTQVLQMPLIVSGLQAAFATGAPYDGEIAALRRIMPEMSIPEPVLAKAMTGLARPDVVARDFNAVLPDILAGRPINADGDWQDVTSDWIRGIMAIRPSGAVEGNDPEAVVARIEAAIARGDFAAAQSELAALPQPMLAAAGDVAGKIADQAAAQSFLSTLRQSALARGNGA